MFPGFTVFAFVITSLRTLAVWTIFSGIFHVMNAPILGTKEDMREPSELTKYLVMRFIWQEVIVAGIFTFEETNALLTSANVDILSSGETFSIFFFCSTVHLVLTPFFSAKTSLSFRFALFAYL